jgi:hypothetical protein
MTAIPESVRRGYASSTVPCLPDEAITYYRELAQAGLTYFIAGVYGNDVETVKLLAECVMPALSDEVVRA